MNQNQTDSGIPSDSIGRENALGAARATDKRLGYPWRAVPTLHRPASRRSIATDVGRLGPERCNRVVAADEERRADRRSPSAARHRFARNLDKTKRRVFGLTKCARLYALLDKAEVLSGVTLPPGSVISALCCAILTPCGGVYSPTQTPPPSLRPGPMDNAASVYEHSGLVRRIGGSPTRSRRRHVRKTAW